jgi:hypothetical protein
MLVIGGMAWMITIDLARDFSKVVGVDHRRSEHAAAMHKCVSDMQIAVLSLSLSDDPGDQKFQLGPLDRARADYRACRTPWAARWWRLPTATSRAPPRCAARCWPWCWSRSWRAC